MNFPLVNGPDEGTFFYMAIMIYSGYAGNVKFWSVSSDCPLGGTWTRTDKIAYSLIFLFTICSIIPFVNM